MKKDFLELLKETSGLDRHSRWSDTKKRLDSDARYKAVDSSSRREDYFRDYVKSLKDSSKRDKSDRSERHSERKNSHRDDDKSRDNKSRDKDKEKDKDDEVH